MNATMAMHIATAALIGVLVGLGAFLLDHAMNPPQTCAAVERPAYPAEAAASIV